MKWGDKHPILLLLICMGVCLLMIFSVGRMMWDSYLDFIDVTIAINTAYKKGELWK